MKMVAVRLSTACITKKVVIKEKDEFPVPRMAARSTLTQLIPGICKYYRWDYTETWKFRLLIMSQSYMLGNFNSRNINIKNTSVLTRQDIALSREVHFK